MSKLGLKILIIFLVISLGGLTLTSFFIYRLINTNFHEYLNQRRQETDKQIVELIENLYQESGDWEDIIPRLNNLDLISRKFIRIVDRNGNNLYSSLGPDNRVGNGMMRGMMRRRMNEMMNWTPDLRNNIFQTANIYDLSVDGQLIGKIYISSPESPGLLSPRDQYFASKIYQAIIKAAVIIALFTILFSLYFSRYLSRPLLEMSNATQRIAEGDFKQRIMVSGNDELAKLGRAFNDMATKLEHLEKIRQESTSDLAHELRTPLSTMRSYLEAMEDGIVEMNKENISSLHSELMRLVRLVDRLGELSEVEGKMINLKKTKLPLVRLIYNVRERFTPLAREKGISFNINYNREDIYFYGNKDSIEQIFSNLFSNAIKYTETNGEISVSLRQANDQIEITISDTGIGISNEDLPYIFERFYRADKSRNRGTGGTGIGLALTRKLIEAHNGTITVKSKPGEGSVFIIHFPLSQIM